MNVLRKCKGTAEGKNTWELYGSGEIAMIIIFVFNENMHATNHMNMFIKFVLCAYRSMRLFIFLLYS